MLATRAGGQGRQAGARCWAGSGVGTPVVALLLCRQAHARPAPAAAPHPGPPPSTRTSTRTHLRARPFGDELLRLRGVRGLGRAAALAAAREAAAAERDAGPEEEDEEAEQAYRAYHNARDQGGHDLLRAGGAEAGCCDATGTGSRRRRQSTRWRLLVPRQLRLTACTHAGRESASPPCPPPLTS